MGRKKNAETEHKKQAIREMYINGYTTQEIAEKTGYMESSIQVFLREMGFSVVKKRISEHRDDCIVLYKQGRSCREIADILGFGVTTVRRNLNRWGCSTGTVSIAGCEREPLPDKGSVLMFAECKKPQLTHITCTYRRNGVLCRQRFWDVTEEWIDMPGGSRRRNGVTRCTKNCSRKESLRYLKA